MRFEDEQYVRLYKRDTTTWKMLPWQARCLLPLILRKLDRAGILDLGTDGLEALAVHIEMPLEVVEPGIASLLKRSVLVLRDDGVLLWPKFIDGQEAKQSDKARQKAARDRARDVAQAETIGVTLRDSTVTLRDGNDTPRDSTVTRRHAASQGVTLSSAQLSPEVISPAHLADAGSVGSTPSADARTERLVDLGTPRCQAACETFVSALADRGWSRGDVRAPWERQALCDAINANLRADGTAQGMLAELRRAVDEWALAHEGRQRFTSGWSPRKFADWLAEGREVAPGARGAGVAVAATPSAEPEIDYPPPTPEEAAELEQALRDMIDPTKGTRANVGAHRPIGEDLPPDDLARLEAKRVETVARLRAEIAASASSPAVGS